VPRAAANLVVKTLKRYSGNVVRSMAVRHDEFARSSGGNCAAGSTSSGGGADNSGTWCDGRRADVPPDPKGR